MFVAVLMLAALAGGVAVTYALMDAPRRHVQTRLAKLQADADRVADEADRLDEWESRLVARERAADGAAAAHNQRVKEFAARFAEFEKRVIAYEELQTENRILKADLRNLHVSLAHQSHTQAATGRTAAAVAADRDQLGRLYFDEVLAAAVKGVTESNYLAAKKRVQAAADRVRVAGADLPAAELTRALADLHARYERAVRAGVEREHQARLREQMRDDLRREKEIQEATEAAARAERERQAIAAQLEDARRRALADAAGAHAAEVEALKAKLAEAEAKSQRAISLAELVKHGNVYVISNRGSFGPDVFKIGMTRRLDPMDRVIELGDASVPFPFDVHAMISCEDAPKLENALHKRFHTRRVNKVNLRKEFFRVTIEEVITAVKELHGEVEYKADAEALQYIQSQTMTDAELAEVTQVLAAAEAAVSPAGVPTDDE